LPDVYGSLIVPLLIAKTVHFLGLIARRSVRAAATKRLGLQKFCAAFGITLVLVCRNQNFEIAWKRVEYKAEARFLTLKKERRAAVRSAFVSGSARCWAFARARLNSCPFAPVNNLQFLKC
jgi:hypothetical protein